MVYSRFAGNARAYMSSPGYLAIFYSGTPMPTKTFTAKQLATILQVSTHTVYEWVRRNKIPYLRAGRGHLRFNPTEVGRALRQDRPPLHAA